MTPEARAFLDQLDEIVSKNDETSREVLAVVTALRSHDALDDGHIKSVATIPIRRAALPKTAAAVDARSIATSLMMRLEDPDDAERIDLRSLKLNDRNSRSSAINTANYHFAVHAQAAAKVLGLRIVR